MPFQAIPLAMRRNTGSPLAKLLLIYLTATCKLPDVENLGGSGPYSATHNLDADEAAAFCQVNVEEIYPALALLERLGLARPCPQWIWQNDRIKTEADRWEFLGVALPLSAWPGSERKRIKASDDQLDILKALARYHCPTCGRHEERFTEWAVDHIIPRSIGGADVEENCQAICADCNRRKHAKVHWVDFLGGRR